MKFRFFLLSAVFMLSPLYAGEPASVGNQLESAVKDKMRNTANQAFSYGDSMIESWARDNFSSLRLIELSLIHISEPTRP